MTETNTLKNNQLDVLGTQPSLYKLYTQICSIYPLPDSTSHDRIVTTLRNGLDRLAQNFPWLAGYVINEGSSEGVTGTYRIVPTDSIPLVVKDLRGDASMPSLDTIREAGFPFRMLDENVIAPCMTINIPGMPVGLVADHGPVFAVQANFIEGGLVLTIVAQHNTMDMHGQKTIINWLSKACHNESFSNEELEVGNTDKSQSYPLLPDSWEPGPEIAQQLVKPPVVEPKSNAAQTQLPPPKASWGYVTFSSTALETLKIKATQTKRVGCNFVSTDDTVCAFIWTCLSRARASRLKPDVKSIFARAIDVRPRLGLPSNYPGACTNMTFNELSIRAVGSDTLGGIASDIRRQLDPNVTDMAHNTRAFATYLSRCTDKSKLNMTGSTDPSSGIMLSSWAGINLYDLDFNLGLGKPESVRRPCFLPVESLMYIMPKSPNGDMAVAICITDEDWERLKEDEEWKKHAKYLG
ncbi:acetyltransferase [Pochonia chlamydosporia 170]|uniref:Acetyltransferase n=1 Tax=Pochonia chlamydosporia 170 TaxID=1380566 RepID=A0A179G2E0_METCM|nr:acetyltransferase [Pochonia chlamydosporia 170]OAQ72022.1 acetyltransferase [Pochonia chlamydosporia 170]